MILNKIMDKMKNRIFKNCIVKLKFDKKGMLVCCFKETKLDKEGEEHED